MADTPRRTSDDDLPAHLLAAARTFPTGARPTPRHRLAAATPFQPLVAPPAQVAYVPAKLDYWGNNQYGVCVSSEEAFAKACHNPEIFIPAATVISFARQHGWLDGAYLEEVMDMMQSSGFDVGAQRYNDGKYTAADYSSESILQAALAAGPVKIAIDHSALPSGAGNNQGWYALGGKEGQYRNTDHCVGVAGYGPAKWLYEQLKVALPAKIKPDESCYLLFTWSTIGVVDHDWLMSTCVEAWVRNPTTVGVPPLPPEPTPNPDPPVPPGPNPPTPPPGPGNPPYRLYESGNMVGLFAGYPDPAGARTAAHAFADHDKTPVEIRDGWNQSVETIQPDTPPGPGPGPNPPTPPTPGQYPIYDIAVSGQGVTLTGTATPRASHFFSPSGSGVNPAALLADFWALYRDVHARAPLSTLAADLAKIAADIGLPM